MKHLQQAILEWQASSDTLIIGGDWNADTTHSTWKKFWSNLGLYEPRKGGHGRPEATYNRQVDTLYVSPQLGSLEFEVIPISEGICGMDHKALLIRVPKSILGMGHLPQQQYHGRQLKIQDPRIQKRYNMELKKQCQKHQLRQWTWRYGKIRSPATN